MLHINWTSAMELGIPEIDRAHRMFLRELNRVLDTPDSDFPERLDMLVAQIERDFAEEGKLMEEIDFPAMQSHVEQHARVLSGLHHTMSKVMSGDVATGRKAIELLFSWFQVHVPTMDAALAMAADAAATERKTKKIAV